MVRGGTEIVKLSFLKLQARQGGKEGGLRDRGNVLTYVGGERMEVAVGVALPGRELGKLVGEKGGEVERVMRETFENGVSVEAEFAFMKGVAEYCKKAVREGNFRGRLQAKPERTDGKEDGCNVHKGREARCADGGGSQMRKMEKEMGRKGREVVKMRG